MDDTASGAKDRIRTDDFKTLPDSRAISCFARDTGNALLFEGTLDHYATFAMLDYTANTLSRRGFCGPRWRGFILEKLVSTLFFFDKAR